MITADDWRQEREWLETVTEKLREGIAELEPEVSGLRGEATDIRKRFWEEVTVDTSTHEDFEETFYSIRQQEAVLSERERSYRNRQRRWQGMKRLLPSPYFGRIDFREAGEDAAERIYIGVASFAAEGGMSFLVYDWRTPIASLYYDHSPGAADYDTPGGTIEGEMLLKRQYRIRDGRLRDLFDTSLTIGDELLQQVLGQGADDRMKSIVATIQKEQNAIIRDDRSRMLIVQGAAGSGKTSAALQRAAYLLYRHRDKLKADQIVLFSPNSMFNSYVSTVLPELGEENMQQTTFQEYLNVWLGGAMRLEDPFDQIEYVLTAGAEPGYEARLDGIRYKASEAFLGAIEGFARRLNEEGMLFRAIRFRDRELISAERMRERFYGFDGSVRPANRVLLLRDWLLRELTALEREEREAAWVGDELDYLDADSYQEAYGELMKKIRRDEPVFDFTRPYLEAGEDRAGGPGEDGLFDLAEREEELLRASVAKKAFEPLRRDVRRFRFLDVVGLYAQLFEEDAAAYRRRTDGAEETGAGEECDSVEKQIASDLSGTGENDPRGAKGTGGNGEAHAKCETGTTDGDSGAPRGRTRAAAENSAIGAAAEQGVPERWAAVCGQTKEKLERGELPYEDATPFLYLKELLEGVRTNTQVRHVFVDEGQDYSPFQYAFLRRLFPRARMTVLGDFGQAIFVQATNLQAADSPLVRLYGEDETRLIRLDRSYRSTKEIVAFSKALLPGGESIVPFERSGAKPLLVRASDARRRAARMAEAIRELRAEGLDSIAVLTKTAAESREACEALAGEGVEDLRPVTKETRAFETGTAVIPVYLAKGVEFDAVLIYDASDRAYGRESERKLFYTACTRAMHRLLLYATGELTPFVRGLSSDLYEEAADEGGAQALNGDGG